MRPRNVLYLVIAVLLLIIVLINWNVIAQSTELNLIVTRVNAPLGVLMVLIAVAILAIDFSVHSLNRLSWARERRDLNAQLEKQRLVADQAEESRLRTLTEKLEQEAAAIRAKLDELAATLRTQR